jgi:hypothetical protein
LINLVTVTTRLWRSKPATEQGAVTMRPDTEIRLLTDAELDNVNGGVAWALIGLNLWTKLIWC